MVVRSSESLDYLTDAQDTARLKNIQVTGKGLRGNLVEVCSSAKITCAFDQVTEMSLTFNDTQDLSIFRSGILTRGASIVYGQWKMVVSDVSVGPGNIGPKLDVVAPSRTVSSLRAQTGAKTWGTVDASSWVVALLKSVGATPLVQPGLGKSILIRNAPEPGSAADTSWDVLTDLAKEKGVWLFERGSVLVFAKPSWLLSTSLFKRRTWALNWDNWAKYSEGLAGMPKYENAGSQSPPESLSVGLISTDADSAKPGDAVVLGGTGVGVMGGKWIVESVDIPFTQAAPVVLTCARPVDPKKEAPRNSPEKKAAPVAGRTSTSSSSNPYANANIPKPVAAVSSAADRWINATNGRAVDFDGAYGAQCVDLVAAYNRDVVGGPNIRGNGNQWYGNPSASGAYVRIGAGATAAKGDIACWGSYYGGGYGHVAIVIADQGGSIRVLTQNPGPANITTLSKQGLQGYLRPRRTR